MLGIGDLTSNLNFSEKGAMADVAASPNDPIFINHHTMIDCIMEEWINMNTSDVSYPSNLSITFEGHRENDYIVPFIPLQNHGEMLQTSLIFGYKCDLNIGDDDDSFNFLDNLYYIVIVGFFFVYFCFQACLLVMYYVIRCCKASLTRFIKDKTTYIKNHPIYISVCNAKFHNLDRCIVRNVRAICSRICKRN